MKKLHTALVASFLVSFIGNAQATAQASSDIFFSLNIPGEYLDAGIEISSSFKPSSNSVPELLQASATSGNALASALATFQPIKGNTVTSARADSPPESWGNGVAVINPREIVIKNTGPSRQIFPIGMSLRYDISGSTTKASERAFASIAVGFSITNPFDSDILSDRWVFPLWNIFSLARDVSGGGAFDEANQLFLAALVSLPSGGELDFNYWMFNQSAVYSNDGDAPPPDIPNKPPKYPDDPQSPFDPPVVPPQYTLTTSDTFPGVVLNPVPEPGTLLLTLTAALLLVGHRKMSRLLFNPAT